MHWLSWELLCEQKLLCVSVLRVASGPRVKLASCKSALTPPVVYSTDRSKAVVPVLVLLFLALWFILRDDLFYVFPCVILFLCFLVHIVLRLPRFGKRELILVRFVRLFDLCLFGFVGFLFLLGSGKGCGLWLWHSLDFSLTFFLFYEAICFMSYLVLSSLAFSKKSEGTLFLAFRGAWCGHAWSLMCCAWFRIFSGYLVPLTPPTVFVQSFWNFAGALRMVWRYACVYSGILKLFFIAFFTFWT